MIGKWVSRNIVGGGGVSKIKERPKDIFPRGELEFKRGGWAPKDTM